MSIFNFNKFIYSVLFFIIISLLSSFQIFANGEKLKVISPNGGENLQIGTYQGISWTYTNIDQINISFSIDEGNNWKLIFDSISTEIGVISWKIPDLVGEHIIIKISDVNGIISDISDFYFTVNKKISLKGALGKSSKINTATVIMPLGNSITYDNRAGDTRAIGDKYGYRLPLYNLLTNAGINFSFTGSEHAGGNYLPAGFDNNAGFPGITDDQLLHLLKTGRRVQYGYDEQITPGRYFDTYPADIVLLHIGTNGNEKYLGTSSDEVEKILDNIDSIDINTTVILARIIDRAPNETYVNTFNNNIEAMALDRVNNPANDAYPDKIIIVDMEDSAEINYTIDSMGTVGNGIVGDMNDLLHPNDKGYSKMAQVWFNALAAILITTPTITLQPTSIYAIAAQQVQFEIKAIGTKPLSYQWKKNGIVIPGATDSIYYINSVSLADDSASFTCTVSNIVDTVTSDIAYLYVSPPFERITTNLQILYNFEDNNPNIKDFSNSDNPVNLTIEDTSKIKWIPYGLKIVSPTRIYASNSPLRIYDSCTTTNEISIEMWLKASNTTQNGPARIITFSKDSGNRNFTLGQQYSKYIVRLKTTNTSKNGIPATNSDSGCVTTELTHIVYTRTENGNASIYINGVLKNSEIISGNFSTWDNTFSFGLANEFISDRSWLGTYYLAAIYNRALSANEVQHNYSSGFNGDDRLLFPPTELAGNIVEDTLVSLSWRDNSDEELGYIIERKANSVDSVFYTLDTLNADIITYTDSYPKHYTSYIYRVKAYNSLYISDYSDSIIVDGLILGINDTEVLITDFNLYQNYPNPFNPSTTISYSIPKASKVSLTIYDILGKVVANLINNSKVEKGNYTYKFDTSSTKSNLTSGVYFYRFVANPIDGSETFMETKKLLLLK